MVAAAPMGRSHGHHRAVLVTVSGQVSCPPLGSSCCPLTGGRPPHTDPTKYAKRHVIENSFQRFKQWRGLATRYYKLASTYRAAVLLRAILLWLPALAQVS